MIPWYQSIERFVSKSNVQHIILCFLVIRASDQPRVRKGTLRLKLVWPNVAPPKFTGQKKILNIPPACYVVARRAQILSHENSMLTNKQKRSNPPTHPQPLENHPQRRVTPRARSTKCKTHTTFFNIHSTTVYMVHILYYTNATELCAVTADTKSRAHCVI